MNALITFAVQNSAVALVLAIFVYGLTRVWRNPPASHMLWLLVLLKLVTPPIVIIDWPMLQSSPESPAATQRLASGPPIDELDTAISPRFIDPPHASTLGPARTVSRAELGPVDDARHFGTK